MIEYLQQHIIMTVFVSFLLGVIAGMSWRTRIRISYTKTTQQT